MTAEQFLLGSLLLVWLGLDGLALVYLIFERKLSRKELGWWCFLALLIPVVGPISVIAGRPGQPRK